ncbi:hypothetical protein SLE2022_126850 [Rubroshorea leprosula]
MISLVGLGFSYSPNQNLASTYLQFRMGSWWRLHSENLVHFNFWQDNDILRSTSENLVHSNFQFGNQIQKDKDAMGDSSSSAVGLLRKCMFLHWFCFCWLPEYETN